MCECGEGGTITRLLRFMGGYFFANFAINTKIVWWDVTYTNTSENNISVLLDIFFVLVDIQHHFPISDLFVATCVEF